MSNENNYNPVVSLLRVFGMLMIVLCHVVDYYTFIPGAAQLGQVLNVGVYVFLMISGYLYGSRTVSGFGKWLLGRWVKICVPVIVLTVLDICALALAGVRTDVVSAVVYLFGLQGFLHISWGVFSGITEGIQNLGPLWFTTVVMLCYCLVPALQALRKRVGRPPRRNLVYAVSVVALFAFSFVVRAAADVIIGFFAVFIVGYVLGSVGFDGKGLRLPRYIVFTLFALAMQAARLALRSAMDESPVYLAFAGTSHALLGMWIFISAFGVWRLLPRPVERFSSSMVVRACDKKSYYVYLTHGVFCTGTAFNLYLHIHNLALASLAFAAATVLSALVLCFICERVLTRKKLK